MFMESLMAILTPSFITAPFLSAVQALLLLLLFFLSVYVYCIILESMNNGPLLRQEAAASAIIINISPECIGLPSAPMEWRAPGPSLPGTDSPLCD